MKFLIVVSCLVVVACAQRYNGPYHVPVIGPNGVPQEPPEVVAARQKHLSAFQGLPQPQAQYNPPQQQWGQQQQGQQQWGQQQQGQQWNQQQQAPQQWQQQQPQAQYAPPQPRYTGPLARIGPDGMPQYDGAVQAARQAHQAAYAEVNSRNAALHSQVAPANHWQG